MSLLSREQQATLERSFREGIGDREIERMTGIHRDTIGRWRDRLGVPRSPRIYRGRPGVASPFDKWPELWIDQEVLSAMGIQIGGPLPWQRRERRLKSFRHLQGSERYQAVLALDLCGHCEHRPRIPGQNRCSVCLTRENTWGKRQRRQRIEAGLCGQCGKPSRGAFRCADCRAQRASQRPDSSAPREPMVRIASTFLDEDLEQERILAELEERPFDARDFYKRYAPHQEQAILDRPLGSDSDSTLHDVIAFSQHGEAWMSRRLSGGGFNAAEERMVRRLDREPTIEELRAEGEARPWQSYVHAVSLDQAEEVIAAWLEFIARMTPDEFAENNLEAQIEATLPGLSMGEILRCIREALAWSERDAERHANEVPGVVRKLERGEIHYRTCRFQALAAALSAVTQLEPGRLRAHLSAAWGSVGERAERRVVIEAQRDARKRQHGMLTQNLGELLTDTLARASGS